MFKLRTVEHAWVVMAAALVRPTVAERTKLPQSCSQVARHDQRRVTHGDPGELQSFRTIARGAEVRPISGHFWRILAMCSPRLAHCGPNLGHRPLNSASLGRFGPISAMCWPKLAHSGQTWSRLANMGRSWRRRCWPLINCGMAAGRSRALLLWLGFRTWLCTTPHAALHFSELCWRVLVQRLLFHVGNRVQ